MGLRNTGAARHQLCLDARSAQENPEGLDDGRRAAQRDGGGNLELGGRRANAGTRAHRSWWRRSSPHRGSSRLGRAGSGGRTPCRGDSRHGGMRPRGQMHRRRGALGPGGLAVPLPPARARGRRWWGLRARGACSWWAHAGASGRSTWLTDGGRRGPRPIGRMRQRANVSDEGLEGLRSPARGRRR